ncbi:hypothetical protein [Desulfosarcina ovata]|uniref:hypothetical protein n=1 Tax=Desulfosarcina ovata TaxID=83564 RepID=UPI0038B3D5ED
MNQRPMAVIQEAILAAETMMKGALPLSVKPDVALFDHSNRRYPVSRYHSRIQKAWLSAVLGCPTALDIFESFGIPSPKTFLGFGVRFIELVLTIFGAKIVCPFLIIAAKLTFVGMDAFATDRIYRLLTFIHDHPPLYLFIACTLIVQRMFNAAGIKLFDILLDHPARGETGCGAFHGFLHQSDPFQILFLACTLFFADFAFCITLLQNAYRCCRENPLMALTTGSSLS